MKIFIFINFTLINLLPTTVNCKKIIQTKTAIYLTIPAITTDGFTGLKQAQRG